MITIYLIFGMAFMKYKNKVKGIQMIPNITMWENIFNNAKVIIYFKSEFNRLKFHHILFKTDWIQFGGVETQMHKRVFKIIIYHLKLNKRWGYFIVYHVFLRLIFLITLCANFFRLKIKKFSFNRLVTTTFTTKAFLMIVFIS